jgi:hypothetical protein
MAWQNELVIIIRHIVDDLDRGNYQFSDDRIEEAILVAAQLIRKEMDFSINYLIDVDNRVLSPDPTTTPVDGSLKDDDFIALCCLRAGILFTGSQLKTYSLRAIALRDGPSSLDLRGVVAGLKALHDDLNEKYEQAKMEYETGKRGVGQAILSPYSPGSSSYYGGINWGYF